MKKYLFLLILITLLILSNVNMAQENKTALDLLANDFIETLLEFRPVSATLVGNHKYDDLLSDHSAEHINHVVKKFQELLTKVELIDQGDLTIDEQIDHELLISNLKMEIFQLEQLRFWQKNPTVYVDECVQGIYSLLLRDFAPISVRAKNVALRLAEIPRVISEARQNIKNPSQTFTIAAIEELQTGEKFIDQSAKELSQQFPELNKELKTNAKQALKAMAAYRKELQKLLPKLKDNFAIGKENFDYILKIDHFLPYDSDSLLRLGENIFTKTDFAINVISQRKFEYEMKLPRSQKPELIPSKEFSKQDILFHQEHEIDSMRAWVKNRDIATIPDYLGKIDIVGTPSFLKGIIPSLALRPAGPLDSVPTSYLYIPPIPNQMDSATKHWYYLGVKNRFWRNGILHECYPGHHFQLSIANHHPSLIRKLQASTILIEGWALYCEQMVVDNGLYPDDLFKELHWLNGVRFRAARVILDVMLQTGRMTFDEAVDFLLDRFGTDTTYYQKEVRRYCLLPTQPMSYLVGKTLIMELRDEYKQKMGDKYSLKDFHDKLLAEGSIPISLIRKKLLSQ